MEDSSKIVQLIGDVRMVEGTASAARLRRDQPQPGAIDSAVVLFPLRYRSAFVRAVAEQIKLLPTRKERSDYMISLLENEFNRELDIGLDEEIAEADLVSFADAVWSIVHRKHRGGAA
ncbi:DUF6074 family protein [Bradyrhizobium sp. JYMT SZCCT0428]|uniref:DUF6074 family protein n=1 Tax=Bradyrhizobium sp. JYMT SZCCT0428 TaxID=2807673 RepID=UPI001BAC2FBD|nr:DUF6074 family protein [Bradyrhizobium sp. JYMT SZCCT0428]MBR1156812.1 hypothetical protein [Bradyrhizobium sp. JYMT SZCCT0428]